MGDRSDGVTSLADAMAMLKRQVAVTPPPQWVRLVGGFTEHQFAEKRLPTIEELNAVGTDAGHRRNVSQCCVTILLRRRSLSGFSAGT